MTASHFLGHDDLGKSDSDVRKFKSGWDCHMVVDMPLLWAAVLHCIADFECPNGLGFDNDVLTAFDVWIQGLPLSLPLLVYR